MATISDNYDDVPDPDNPDRLFKVPAVLKAQDYYPFGMEMPGRTYSVNDEYRFGFNGKEADKNGEWGGLTHYDYGFRIYNPAVGRFLSVDPLAPNFPWWTPYQFAGNTPIQAVDLDGKEIMGYTDLGSNENWRPALRMLDRNEVWLNYLRNSFAVLGQGDDVGQTENGKYAGITLQFLAPNDQSDFFSRCYCLFSCK